MWELIKAFLYKIIFFEDYFLAKRRTIVNRTFKDHVLNYMNRYHSCKESPVRYCIDYTHHSEDYIDNIAWVRVIEGGAYQYVCLNFIFCKEKNCLYETPRDINVLPIKDSLEIIQNKVNFPTESKITEDADLGKIFLKAYNLRLRFKNVITEFSVMGTSFVVKYYLGYEEKTFIGYYKNNNLKKKLNGAIAFKDVEANLENLVNNVNMFYSNFNSNLRLGYEYLNMEDPAGLRHFKLDICGYVIVDTSKRERLANIYESLGTIEIEMKLKNLISEDLVKIKVGEKVYICNSKAKANEGVLEWKPIFPCNADETIYTAAIAVAEHYYRK